MLAQISGMQEYVVARAKVRCYNTLKTKNCMQMQYSNNRWLAKVDTSEQTFIVAETKKLRRFGLEAFVSHKILLMHLCQLLHI